MTLLYEFTIISRYGHVIEVKNIAASHVSTPSQWVRENTPHDTITQVKVITLSPHSKQLKDGKMFDTMISDTEIYINEGGHVERFHNNSPILNNRNEETKC